jgi:hypothetical protein
MLLVRATVAISNDLWLRLAIRSELWSLRSNSTPSADEKAFEGSGTKAIAPNCAIMAWGAVVADQEPMMMMMMMKAIFEGNPVRALCLRIQKARPRPRTYAM